MPATVLAFELDASDESTLQQEATDAMRSNVDDAVRAEAAARGIRFVIPSHHLVTGARCRNCSRAMPRYHVGRKDCQST